MENEQLVTKSMYGKYIRTDLKQGVVMPSFKGSQRIGQGFVDGFRRPLEYLIWMDEKVIPGAFYAECTLDLAGQLAGTEAPPPGPYLRRKTQAVPYQSPQPDFARPDFYKKMFRDWGLDDS